MQFWNKTLFRAAFHDCGLKEPDQVQVQGAESKHSPHRRLNNMNKFYLHVFLELFGLP